MSQPNNGDSMTTNADAWSGTVAKKSRALLDGSNLYRRLDIRLDNGTHLRVKVDRGLWSQLEVGDRVVKDAGEKPRRNGANTSMRLTPRT